jgi:hypothetical protein
MSNFLRRNREDLRSKVYAKLGLNADTKEDREYAPALQLDRALR